MSLESNIQNEQAQKQNDLKTKKLTNLKKLKTIWLK